MSTEIYKQACDSIIEIDSDKAMAALDQAAAAGIPFVDVLDNGFSLGIEEIGEMFSSGDIFMPELILASKIMTQVATRIEEDMKKRGQAAKNKGKIVMATVAGDVHDIGKGICCMMLRTNGIEVIDLGRDVSVDAIIEAAETHNADLIGTSTLLTMCMDQQNLLEKALKEKGLREKYITIVGGSPVTEKWQKKIGADYYGNTAADLAKLATKLLDEKYS